MDADTLVPARPAPRHPRATPQRMARALLGSPGRALGTVLVAAALLSWLPGLLNWALWHAVWAPDEAACQAARGSGACWGVVAEKHRFILFGRYPFGEQWRPAVATLLLLALTLGSGWRVLWGRPLLLAWPVGLGLFAVLMHGGVAGLGVVPTDQWGGLPLTVLLATVCSALAFPLSVAVALGRRSSLPTLRGLCVLYVELVRGVPLISVLFLASFMFPLLLPAGATPDVLLRVVVGITLFAAAYMAEIVRGGLQAVPAGQVEAAASIGLSWWATQRLVVLPQALTAVLPAMMNNFIAILKDTSLITIVSLYELTGSLGLALNGDPMWRPFLIEGYLFISAVYFLLCFALSRYSRWLERRLARSHTR